MRVKRLVLAAFAATIVLLGTYDASFAALRPAPSDATTAPEQTEPVEAAAKEARIPADVRGEKLEILRMVAEGKLSPEAALDKLEAVEKDRGAQAQWITIEITEGKDRDAVKMSFPLALGEWGLRVAAQQGGEMLRMMGIRPGATGQGAPLEAQLLQKAAELLEAPEGKQALTETIEMLRAGERGHTLFELRDGNDHVRVYLD